MKPCSKNRKPIAWLALGELDAPKAAALRDHLAHCEGCRRYWEETSRVTKRLASAQPDSNLRASESFHRRVAEKIQAIESRSVLEDVAEWLRGWMPDWRVATALALVVALFTMVALRHDAPPPVQVVLRPSAGDDVAPTIANYQRVASESLEELDELLTRQGNKPLPPAPVYTASGLVLAGASF